MTRREVRGVIPPLTTAFTEEGTVYEERPRRLLGFPIEWVPRGFPLRNLRFRTVDVSE